MQIMARQAGEGKRAANKNKSPEGKSMRIFRSFALLGAALGVLLSGAAAAETTYIKAGRMIDVADGRVLRDRVIVVDGERIERVGTPGSIDIPPGARVIDLGDQTVLPGLFDMHVHLIGDTSAQGYQNLAASLPRNTLFGAKNAKLALESGFTSVRNVGAGGYADIALRDAINAGDIPGPRMRASGPALGITGGHCDSNLLPPRYEDYSQGVADGPWAIRTKVRQNIKYGADVTKFCATGGVLSKGTSVGAQQYTLEEMATIVDESQRRGLKVAAHAHGTEGIRTAIQAGVDSVEHASLIDDEGIRMARERDTFLVMDIYVHSYIMEGGVAAGFLPESLEKEKIVGQAQRDNFRKAHEAGVRIAFGSDAGVFPHGISARQFAYMVQYGMTPMEAIQSATVVAAELMGWETDAGALEPGMYADIIAVPGDPIADIRALENVSFVMKGGEVHVDR
jgi:imidazolonepropionase-like amidohydrolase